MAHNEDQPKEELPADTSAENIDKPNAGPVKPLLFDAREKTLELIKIAEKERKKKL